MSGGTSDELRKRFQILERVAIFFTLPDNILHALARRLAPASATRGSVIVHQGDPGDTMFVVESGRCEVFVEESPGHTITIALLGPDDFFGEMSLISEETRTASVRALEDCRLLTLDRRTLYETLPADSDALIELTKLVEQRKDTLPNLIARARMVAPSKRPRQSPSTRPRAAPAERRSPSTSRRHWASGSRGRCCWSTSLSPTTTTRSSPT